MKAEIKTEIRQITTQTVVLEMSREEAETLQVVFRNVGGSPQAGEPRRHIDNLSTRLKEAGILPRLDVKIGDESGHGDALYLSKR